MRILTLFVLVLLCASHTQAQLARQVKMLANWTDSSLPPTSAYNNPYNETWGFEQNGVEYAVVGSTLGLHIFNLNDLIAGNAKQHFIPGASQGTAIIHRDFKDHKGYLYAVCDEGPSKLQILDLRGLPDTVKQVYSSNQFITRAHNLFIDTSQNKLWILGNGGNTKCLDITSPAVPTLIATYPGHGLQLPYTHDAYIRDNIGYMNCGTSGFWVVDFTNPLAPVLKGTMTGYQGAGYNHSGWLSADKSTYWLLDETHGSPIKTVDVTAPDDLKILSSMNAASTTNQIPHNALIRGNYLYTAYYYDGLQVHDISNKTAPKRVGYHDTSTIPNNNSYQGAWGAHPMKTSGRILLSDMQNGLFVFEPIEVTLGSDDLVQEQIKVETYPNPASQYMWVSTAMQVEICNIFNQNGQLVRTQRVAGQQAFSVELAGLASGVYHLALRDAEGKGVSRKILVE